VLDIIVMGVPMPELWNLTLSTKKKIYIMMMFSLGILYVQSLLLLFPL